jgi:hypothetical protein
MLATLANRMRRNAPWANGKRLKAVALAGLLSATVLWIHTVSGAEATAAAGPSSGQVLTHEQQRAAFETLSAFSSVIVNETQVLRTNATPCAMVNRAVADVNREPRPLAERMTQARLGEVVRILDDQGDWVRVQLEADGGIGVAPWSQVLVEPQVPVELGEIPSRHSKR